MAKLTLYAASMQANKEDRTLSGRLLPFNEVGYTNLGKVTASKESKLDAADVVTLNVQHDGTRPVGKHVSLTAADDGIDATFKLLATRAGDDALVEAEEGVRAALSVELEPVVIKDGKIVSGTIVAAALVTEPAFASARLAASELENVPDTEEAPKTPDVVIDGTPVENVESVEVTETKIEVTTKKAEEPPADSEDEDKKMAAAAVNNPALGAAGAKDKNKDDKNALFAALAGVHGKGLSSTKMEAALSDIVPGNILGIEQPQYVGQMWNGVTYERKYIPQFAHGELTSFEIKGWDWGTKPTVGLYNGNKEDIPSGSVTTVATSGTIQRIAGGHDIDRKFRDFSNSEFWEAYFAAMAESYAKVSDTYIRDQIKAIPTAGNGQRVHLLSANAPAGVPLALWQIVEGVVKMIDDLDVLPQFAFVTTDYWKPLLYTKMQDVLAYLDAALNLKDGTLASGGFKIIPVPVGSLNASGGWTAKTLLGHGSAVKVYELPGSPIRVEAEAIAKGGIDEALFGYVGYQTENVKGLISFDAPGV